MRGSSASAAAAGALSPLRVGLSVAPKRTRSPAPAVARRRERDADVPAAALVTDSEDVHFFDDELAPVAVGGAEPRSLLRPASEPGSHGS
eukprot:15433217-Alexandrium_andersonii.AAC.1